MASQITAQIGARTLLMGPALGLEVISYPYPHIHTYIHTYILTLCKYCPAPNMLQQQQQQLGNEPSVGAYEGEVCLICMYVCMHVYFQLYVCMYVGWRCPCGCWRERNDEISQEQSFYHRNPSRPTGYPIHTYIHTFIYA